MFDIIILFYISLPSKPTLKCRIEQIHQAIVLRLFVLRLIPRGQMLDEYVQIALKNKDNGKKVKI
jgi:hypothetical protein